MVANPYPLVSVCIPAYNGANFLGAAIQSVLNQDLTDFELIISDDNSTDHTAEIVAQFQDKRIRYIRNSVNLGPEGNWNKCLELAQGKYFKLLPHDDILAATCLSRQTEVLEKDSDQSIALVFCARQIIDHNDKIITTRKYSKALQGWVAGHDLIKQCICAGTNLLGEPGALLFRRSLALTVGPFDGSISYIIDLDYWFRLLRHGHGFYLDQPLASFRVATGSWSIDIGSRQSADFIHFIERYRKKPEYKLTDFDAVRGKVMAKINNFLRLVFYKLFIPK